MQKVRKILNNFLRHYMPVYAALLLLVCSIAAPASAAPPVSAVVSPLIFDEVGILYGEAFERAERFPWPGNVFGSGYPGIGYVSYLDSSNDFDNFMEIQHLNDTGSSVTADYYLTYDYTGWGVGLYNHSGFVVSEDMLRNGQYTVSFNSESLPVYGNLSLQVTVNKINTNSNSYATEAKTFTLSNWQFSLGQVNLLALLHNTITDYSYRPGEYVYISSLSIRFFFDTTDVVEIGLHTEQSKIIGNPSFKNWVDQYDLPRTVIVNPADPTEVSFTDWLQVAIGGFLDFEIWPGMSLNEIMWIILVIGMLFWFFKTTI